MDFYKYQGAGNDFIIVDNMDLKLEDKQTLAAKLCDRRFGAGADGFIAAEPSDNSSVKMAFYNSDGSIAAMCGNGIRCFSKFVTDMGIVEEDRFTVETGDGQKHIEILKRTPVETWVKVDMGKATGVEKSKLRPALPGASAELTEVYFTHVGVPHAIVFCKTGGEGMAALDAAAEVIGHDIEYDDEFAPDRANVNFVEVIGDDHINCSTWERGAGKTLACGTGACSSALAAHLHKGLGDSIRVTMPGGEVRVSFDGDKVIYMEGTAVLTYRGITPEGV